MSAPLEPQAAFGQGGDAGPSDAGWWPTPEAVAAAYGSGPAGGPAGGPDWCYYKEQPQWEPDPLALALGRVVLAAAVFGAVARALVAGIALYQTIKDALQSRQDGATAPDTVDWRSWPNPQRDMWVEVLDAQREGQDIQVTKTPAPPAASTVKKSHHKAKRDGGVG